MNFSHQKGRAALLNPNSRHRSVIRFRTGPKTLNTRSSRNGATPERINVELVPGKIFSTHGYASIRRKFDNSSFGNIGASVWIAKLLS